MKYDKLVKAILESQEETEDAVWNKDKNRYITKSELSEDPNYMDDLDGLSFDDNVVTGTLTDYLSQPYTSMTPDAWLQMAVIAIKNNFDKSYAKAPHMYKTDDDSDPFDSELEGIANKIVEELPNIAVDKNSLGRYMYRQLRQFDMKGDSGKNLFSLLKQKQKQLEAYNTRTPVQNNSNLEADVQKYINDLKSTTQSTISVGSNWQPSKGINWLLSSVRALPEQQRDNYINQLVQVIQNSQPGTPANTLKQTYANQPDLLSYFKKFVNS
jgi:hypothetical protein